MNKVAVRFNYTNSFYGVFIQPLYYLSENIRQTLYKNSTKLVNNEINTVDTDSICETKIDNDLFIIMMLNKNKNKNYEINNIISLEINLSPIPIDDWKNINLSYILNKYNNQIIFIYKGKQFELNIIELNTNNLIITENNKQSNTLYTAYEIIFNCTDIRIFDEFIKTSINYYEKHNNINNDNNQDTINISISSTDGFYFNNLGKRYKRDLNSIYLPKKQKQDITNDLENFLKPETKIKYRKLGINYKRIYLLEGIPGTGKTSLITGLASKFNFNIAIISFVPKMTDIDLIRSIKTVHSHDDENDRKTFLVIEDIDCIFKERKNNDEQRNNITFSGLLNALDGITSNDMICFITTNYKCNLDSALIRPGRIDYIMKFDYAIKEQIVDIFKDFTSETNNDIIENFYKACVNLNIKITTSLLQQYLIKYIDKSQEAIDNISEMKIICNNINIFPEAIGSGLYS